MGFLIRRRLSRGLTVLLGVATVGLLVTASAYATAPINDNQANYLALVNNATPPAHGGSYSQTTAGATKEAGESNHAGDAGGASVWFRWTADFTGNAYVSTAGSDFDTLLEVTSVGQPPTPVAASNDDIQDSAGVSEVCFPVTQGEVLTIGVDGYAGASGNLKLSYGQFDNSISCPNVPPTISGSTAHPIVGDVLTGNSGSWITASPNATFQWWRCHEYGCLKITGATSHTYTVQARDVGESLMFEETLALNPPTATRSASDPTGTVARQNTGLTDGRIFWSTNEGHQGNFDIYSMFPDGSHLLQITNNTVDFEAYPSTTLDGQTLAYTDEYNGAIWVADADGGRPVTTGYVGNTPAWSPDIGSRLAYVGSDTIYITDGTNNDPLTRLLTGSFFDLAWSHDGTKIAFAYKPTGASKYQIAVMNADGRTPLKIITSGSSDNWAPSWNPNGTKIAFLHGDQDLPINERDLYEMNADGTGQV